MRQSVFTVLLFCTCGSLLSCSNNQTKEEKTTETQPVALVPQSKLDSVGTSLLMTSVGNYYELKDALVATDAAKSDVAAQKLIASIADLHGKVKDSSLSLQLDTINLESKALIAETNDPKTDKKRVHFEKVSNAMFTLLRAADLKNAGIYRQHCPMAFNDKGAYWLSNETEIKNPYFGKKMLECGEVTDSLK
ncbi:MAG: DUF3347 domain-containing protein [Bacteroidetes bacterium]|nr:DUF3347 domain-containing protein [Bacteroidota bacterium]